MAKFRLYVFSEPSGERECVVISDRSYKEVQAEHADGRAFDVALDIDGDAGLFPCDRELVYKLP